MASISSFLIPNHDLFTPPSSPERSRPHRSSEDARLSPPFRTPSITLRKTSASSFNIPKHSCPPTPPSSPRKRNSGFRNSINLQSPPNSPSRTRGHLRSENDGNGVRSLLDSNHPQDLQVLRRRPHNRSKDGQSQPIAKQLPAQYDGSQDGSSTLVGTRRTSSWASVSSASSISVSVRQDFGIPQTVPARRATSSPDSTSSSTDPDAEELPTPPSITHAKRKASFSGIRPLTNPTKTPDLTRRRPPLISHGSSSSSARSRSTITPDRFIPERRSPNSSGDSYRLNRPVNKLTGPERYTRNYFSSPDPFSVHSRGNSRAIETEHARRSPQTPSIRRTSGGPPGILGLREEPPSPAVRQVSNGAIWNVGGSAPVLPEGIRGIPDGRGSLLGSGTNAPLFRTAFLEKKDEVGDTETHERRLALALDVDIADRVLSPSTLASPVSPHTPTPASRFQQGGRTVWQHGEWHKDDATSSPKKMSKGRKAVPIIPFRVLDAPALRDDYYCSLIAYSHTKGCLAVGLSDRVYLWSESDGVEQPVGLNAARSAHVTSLSFSSSQGGQAILAVGRADGRFSLWSPLDGIDDKPRFETELSSGILCVVFRSDVVKRPSKRDQHFCVNTEELLVGDEAGHVYLYSVEWPSAFDSDLFGYKGALTLLAKISVHTQQICGLAWSPNGEMFATGGNDNFCFLFETRKILKRHDGVSERQPEARLLQSRPDKPLAIGKGHEKHYWLLNAACKAIAFCPWQRGLMAAGGGSNDRCIHFYHTVSGACLATIDCAAQVTSLIWSTTRREIAATFGFAQPDHPYRIAVFSWPQCEQVVAIPWYDEHRALYAIPYPGSPGARKPGNEHETWYSRTAEEGCIAVATSDASIKFHEIWSGNKRATGPGQGLLGGSDILEALHGIEKEGPVIR